jgi:radical SAM protein with 4Fe4S-binding SPASM domain
MKMLRYVELLKYMNSKTFSMRHLMNRFNVMMSYHRKDPVVKGFAPMVHIEPTNACNLQCEMCPRDQQDRPVGYMEISVYKQLIDELASLGTELIYLHLFGEPTLHPDIFEMIKYAKGKEIDIAMSTNATTLDQDMRDALIKSGMDILIISFDAADNPEYYEKIRKNADYQTVFSNIKNFLNSKKDNKPFTIIQTICMKGSEHADIYLKKVLPSYRNMTISNKPFDEWGGKVERINELSTVDIRYEQEKRLCEKIWRTAMIHYDGTVVPCSRCYDKEFALGKFPENSMEEIWNNNKFVEMRKTHIEDRMLHEYCKSCYYVGLSVPEEIVLAMMDATFFEKVIHEVQDIRDRKLTLK